ncbi:MAG: hypothetical protein EA352_03770 [Gemmatimonadales bacterium]|nr:MAG: hypothetical protein EA352_03770 [Gemmatimonadales bacterium]
MGLEVAGGAGVPEPDSLQAHGLVLQWEPLGDSLEVEVRREGGALPAQVVFRVPRGSGAP